MQATIGFIGFKLKMEPSMLGYIGTTIRSIPAFLR